VERVTIPAAEEIRVLDRKKPKKKSADYMPYSTDSSLIPVLPDAGEGYRLHITGLTHDERGYPLTDAETQDRLVSRLIQKIRRNRDLIIDYEESYLEGAEVVVITYGSSYRPALKAVRNLRRDDLPIGLLKLNTVWPFAEDLVRKLAGEIQAFVVAEVNFGQIALEVERCACGQALTKLIPHAGGGIHRPPEIEAAVREVLSSLGSQRIAK
jgi:2-oxoglutarate ferredoxin oxidoreductase subunit alpha